MVLQIVSVGIKIIAIVVDTLVAARFIELYVYNAFAAIPITTLCYQELHNVGIGFLKSYAGVALQGSILYLVIGFYPALAASVGTGGGMGTSGAVCYFAGRYDNERKVRKSHHKRRVMIRQIVAPIP